MERALKSLDDSVLPFFGTPHIANTAHCQIFRNATHVPKSVPQPQHPYHWHHTTTGHVAHALFVSVPLKNGSHAFVRLQLPNHHLFFIPTCLKSRWNSAFQRLFKHVKLPGRSVYTHTSLRSITTTRIAPTGVCKGIIICIVLSVALRMKNRLLNTY